MTENITQLPTWAQDKIRSLEKDLAYYKELYEKQVKTADGGTGAVKIISRTEADTILHDDAIVRFTMNNVEWDWIEFQMRPQNNLKGVTVQSQGRLLIRPGAANFVELYQSYW